VIASFGWSTEKSAGTAKRKMFWTNILDLSQAH